MPLHASTEHGADPPATAIATGDEELGRGVCGGGDGVVAGRLGLT